MLNSMVRRNLFAALPSLLELLCLKFIDVHVMYPKHFVRSISKPSFYPM
jgi:hypothetical protein